MNGTESSESHGEHQPTRGITMSYSLAEGTTFHSESSIPVDKLKQLLSAQLQYYFSK